jgi:hypothetical protein
MVLTRVTHVTGDISLGPVTVVLETGETVLHYGTLVPLVGDPYWSPNSCLTSEWGDTSRVLTRASHGTLVSQVVTRTGRPEVVATFNCPHCKKLLSTDGVQRHGIIGGYQWNAVPCDSCDVTFTVHFFL